MPEFTCPVCDTDDDVEIERLPKRACDDMEWECAFCGRKLKIGWIAEIEVREVIEV